MKLYQKVMVGFSAMIVGILFLGAVTLNYGNAKPMKMMTVTVLSNAGGTNYQTIEAGNVATGEGGGTATGGLLYRVVTVPGTGGGAPDDNWDLVIVDADGVDVLQGSCANRDTATTESLVFQTPSAFVGAHELRATNMGDANRATVRLYFR